jgi:hypothetical protein
MNSVLCCDITVGIMLDVEGWKGDAGGGAHWRATASTTDVGN